MREAIITTVSRTGGHLGASLGTVELTVALHCELESPRDKIIWDVGHQAYGHKLLTGRLSAFPTLRQHGGLSGFLKRSESEHDVMGAGHASTSISYAVGLAEAERRKGGRRGAVVCVIGDGAMTGGMAYEGMNQAGELGAPVVVVLNDNGMSISQNVGAMSRMLQRARVDSTITRVREELERGLSRVPGGDAFGTSLRDATKALWFESGALFEALGFAYMGPFDGHDVEAVRGAIRSARSAATARSWCTSRRPRARATSPPRPMARRCTAPRRSIPPRARPRRPARRPRRPTPRCSARHWSPRPSAIRASSASRRRCSKARACTT